MTLFNAASARLKNMSLLEVRGKMNRSGFDGQQSFIAISSQTFPT